MSSLRIVLAQVNPLLGDIAMNTGQVIARVRAAEAEQGAELVVFPELNLMGYPPQDLLLGEALAGRVEEALERLRKERFAAAVVVGYPELVATAGDRPRYANTAAVIQNGEITARYRKQRLSCAPGFHEELYFTSDEAEPCLLEVKGHRLALLMAGDLEQEQALRPAASAGAEAAIVVAASPFIVGARQAQRDLFRARAREAALPLVYVNQAGAQDELVFDGASLAFNADGDTCLEAPAFRTGSFLLELKKDEHGPRLESTVREPEQSELESSYQALVLALRDYVEKNGFKGVVLGLSGGIDSALTLAIAVDALGSERVEAVMMPFRYTSEMSQDDAAAQARTLGVHYRSISIENIYEAFMAALADEFSGLPVDTTEQNIQARCRGGLLMALSNKKGWLVVTTGNKSELAVGYSTLYGDMAGGFAVLKDVFKTRVYELARYRNSISPVIPERVITRPPSAELAPDQKDEDSLPAYDVLDPILAAYVEERASAEEIIARGYAREVVEKVLRLVDLNEYKRRQAPPGACISRVGFGPNRRFPMTSGWRW